MFPNQTPEQPQQPSQPQPIQPPVESPVVSPAPMPTAPTPTAPADPVAPNPFGAPLSSEPTPAPSVPSASGPVDTAASPQPKKPVNKKLIAVLIVIVALLGLAAVAYFVVLPMLGSKSSGGTSVVNGGSSDNSKMKLETKKGDGYSILVPSSFTLVPATGSGTSTTYSEDGTDLNTVPRVAICTYDASLAPSLFATYANPMADTVATKGYTFEKMTYKGFEAVRGSSTVVKNGKDLYVSNVFAVKSTKGLTLVTVSIPTGDDSGLKDSVTAIFDSLEIE